MGPTQAETRTWMGSLLEGKRDAGGQMYMRNRYYDPQTGQFTQPDPIGIAGGLNVYGFANGDPVSYSDPYGLCKRDKDGNEDPECRQAINALRAAAAHANVGKGERNLFADAADRYEATGRDVVFVNARERRLNAGRQNSDGDPSTFAMGRTMPNRLFRGKGDILIGNFLGPGDFVMTAAHEMLAHDEQKIQTDISPRIDALNSVLWNQLPDSLRPSAELWRRKLGQ
jgi:RHS repeat-associated protein